MSRAVVHVRVIEGKGLFAADSTGTSDPYVKIRVGDSKHTQKTNVIDKTLDPVYNADFTFEVKDFKCKLIVEVFDKDTLSRDDFIGRVSIPLEPIVESKSGVAGWYQLLDAKEAKPFGGHIALAIVAEDNALSIKGVDLESRRKKLLSDVIASRPKGPEEDKESDISMLVATWNVGNKPPAPAAQLREHLLRPGYDLYAIGAQECEYKPRTGSCEDDWNATLQEALGSEYVLVKYYNLREMRLSVFVRKTLAGLLDRIQASREATGLGDVYGNKGGVAISLTVRDTPICFVSCHLAAHQHKTAARNSDVKQIVEGLKLGDDGTDELNQFEHVFWMGDLNYRLDYGDQGDAKSPSQHQFDDMLTKIGENRLDELVPCDQLLAEMRAGRVFHGFQEGKLTFKPTFKVARVDGKTEYNPQRSPAWTDRVLWLSAPGASVRQTAYGSAEAIGSSDHKPVFAAFQVPTTRLPFGVDDAVGPAEIIIRAFKGKDVPVGDIGGKSDPFVRFHASFLEKPVQTPTRKNTLSPDWGDDTPPIRLRLNSRARLAQSFLRFKLFDADLASESVLAFGQLSLAPFVGGSPAKFSCQLTRSGLAAGTLEGTLEVVWKDR